MVAIGDHRVAVVGAPLHPVQFVAARGTHLDIPELTVQVERDAERIAVAERPNLSVHALVVDEGILVVIVDKGVVFRNRAIVVKAQDLAYVGLHVLGWRELLAVAGRDV